MSECIIYLYVMENQYINKLSSLYLNIRRADSQQRSSGRPFRLQDRQWRAQGAIIRPTFPSLGTHIEYYTKYFDTLWENDDIKLYTHCTLATNLANI
jgi:hypothetical protein